MTTTLQHRKEQNFERVKGGLRLEILALTFRLSFSLSVFVFSEQRRAPKSLDDTVCTTIVCYQRCFPLASSPSGKKSLSSPGQNFHFYRRLIICGGQSRRMSHHFAHLRMCGSVQQGHDKKKKKKARHLQPSLR